MPELGRKRHVHDPGPDRIAVVGGRRRERQQAENQGRRQSSWNAHFIIHSWLKPPREAAPYELARKARHKWLNRLIELPSVSRFRLWRGPGPKLLRRMGAERCNRAPRSHRLASCVRIAKSTSGTELLASFKCCSRATRSVPASDASLEWTAPMPCSVAEVMYCTGRPLVRAISSRATRFSSKIVAACPDFARCQQALPKLHLYDGARQPGLGVFRVSFQARQ